ncbi:MAG: ParB/RepB/Spo0J family partition protein [Proteobacteria bacterium]|nr:ParB/RepB/Spo0J family partition protein [Pseudomonadota bacterium]NIS68223.1 ParB/RepB/Spo0J family partition protein [Pseudomonadota bacterium]
MGKRMALGKGLGALIPDAGREKGELFLCGIEEIVPNQKQPRRRFDEEKIEELAKSIREKGILEPLLVRKSGEGYELIVGERRWRAAQRAGLREVPVLLKNVSNREALELTLVENLQREDLSALEEAEGYRQLIDEFRFTQEELAKRIGKDRSSVTNTLRLLRLPNEVKEKLADLSLSSGHGRALLTLPTEADQNEVCRLVLQKGLSVRETEKLVKQWGKRKPVPLKREESDEYEWKRLQDDLRRFLSTRVQISRKGKGGKILIEFYSLVELQRLVDLIKGEKGVQP